MTLRKTSFPDILREEFGDDFVQKAERLFYKMSVVEDALTFCSVGVRESGVTGMHDATECGVWGGLYEIAQASRCGLVVDKEKIKMKKIYLDYAATTPCHPEVIEEMLPFFNQIYGNPSSVYQLAQKAKGAIEEAREKLPGY